VGGTNCLPMIGKGQMPGEINQIRIGEGILLGRNSSNHSTVKNTHQDAFQLVAEIVEIKKKPSIPLGAIGVDAFGNTPVFKNHGIRTRALIALGKQDVRLPGLIPTDKGIKILGGSSDYIILDITDSKQSYSLGDEVRFNLLYPGLLSVTTSPYVTHYIKEDEN
jgi:predicted amino acid racemase